MINKSLRTNDLTIKLTSENDLYTKKKAAANAYGIFAVDKLLKRILGRGGSELIKPNIVKSASISLLYFISLIKPHPSHQHFWKLLVGIIITFYFERRVIHYF